MKEFAHFIGENGIVFPQTLNIQASFNVVSLLIMVPVKKVPDRLRENFTQDVTALFHLALNATNFKRDNQIFNKWIE